MTDPTHHHAASSLDLAIIGMAGRFPSADSVDALWSNLCNGVEAVTRYDDEALAALGVPAELIADPDYVKAGVRFEGMDRFDATFFGYTPRDAERIDPQHRIFLECAWHALEDAGYDPHRYDRMIGIYAGAGANVYLMRNLLQGSELEQGAGVSELLGLMSGNMPDTLATRVAYKLNLRGPAVTVQTACSTSLMAVHTACQALLGQECDMALAGGVSLNLLQNGGYRYQAGAIFSPDGHCRAFDAKAAGTLQGSGAALVVLKRLDDALRDGDTIHAVIKGSAANNDGSEKVGFTAPSVNGQAAVIRAAQEMADVAADTIGYVEAHGTGTTLGDPIEIAALTQAFRVSTARKQYCAIGSVKTNIGHLDAAAGVTGLIKAALALKHRTLPPSLNYETPNPQIDFANSPFYVNTACKPWETDGSVRRAGVSSFGIGGTNVHVILEEAPLQVAAEMDAALLPATTLHLLPISARTATALESATRHLGDALANARGVTLRDVAHTLRVGRRHMPHRAVALARSCADAAGALQRRDPATIVEGQILSERPSVAFLFPGQGAQHVGMGKALYDTEPVFRACVDKCSALLRPHLALDLRELLYPTADQAAAAAERLAQTAITQPALFVIEYAMAQWWQHQGIQPDAMLGHSIGEYAAACVAGVFTLEDALSIVAARGRLIQSMPPGAMLAISLPEKELRAHRYAGCDLAAVNAADLCVLSGPADAIERAEQDILSRGIGARRLHVSHAFHSAMVEPMLARFEDLLATAPLRAPTIPFLSNVTGQWITNDQATSPAYWANHVRSTVRFADGLGVLLEKSDRVLLEVGPGDTLTALARRHAEAAGRPVIASQCHPQRAASNGEQPARCLAQLWVAGVDVPAMRGDGEGWRVPLPGYPFERERYWVERRTAPEPIANSADRLKAASDWLYLPTWKRVSGMLPTSANVRSPRYVLMFGNNDPFARGLLRALRESGNDVLNVWHGADFAQIGEREYTLDMGNREHYNLLRYALGGDLGRQIDIYHLLNVGVDSPALGDAAFESTLWSLLALAQVFGQDFRTEVAIRVVASGVFDVTGSDALVAERALLQGPCAVIPQEYPNIRCRLIDVPIPSGEEERNRLIEQVIQDSLRASVGGAVSYRGVYAWTRAFEPAQVKLPPESRIRQGGVYLITGGLGGLGNAFATYLARTYQASVVLVTRTDDAARHQHAVSLLEGYGAQAVVMCADVNDATQIQGVVEAVTQRFQTLHGVIHAAGIPGGGAIETRSRSAMERVIAPKCQGSLNLLAAVSRLSLDFFMMCSSLTSITGGFGQVDYCAANAFQDALAWSAAKQRKAHVRSVNWDVWRGVGMAARQVLPDGVGIPLEMAGALLEAVLGAGQPQTVVSSIHPDLADRRNLASLADVTALLPASSHAQRTATALSTQYVGAATTLDKAIEALWSELLGVGPIGVNDNLFELGGDSLLAIQIIAKVRMTYGVDVHPTPFLRAPTIATLSLLVETALIDQIASGDAHSADPSATPKGIS
ncbi:SDR family NAD(P)-dependent oxidoreductase [Pigmentiphaga litoralis]|uniref:type I polyketide synthase n=1 Tax=Pigmentiphaga litoralis TaxID=516702 RepID=UPI003B438CD4